MKKRLNFRKLPELQDRILSNGSYKLVAFVVAVVLWVNILGRRDQAISREMDLEFLLSSKRVVANNVIRKVKVRVSGPKEALNKFKQASDTITIDLNNLESGWHTLMITNEQINLPLGVKILSVIPPTIKTNIQEMKKP